MATLSLAMIVKNEGDTIERVLGDAKAFCDEMIVVDTGSTDDTVAKAKAMGAKVHHFTWVDDFAAARNFSFSKCTKDWIIWLDGDDTISPENQQKILALKDSLGGKEAVFLRYNFPPYVLWRERMIRRDLFGQTMRWCDPIHECIRDVDVNKAIYRDDIAIQHSTPPGRHEMKKDRNINILRKHFEKGALDERLMFQYAIECIHSYYKEEAEMVVEKFLPTIKYEPYAYDLHSKLYDLYMNFKEPKRAAEAATKALMSNPARAEAFYKLGRYTADTLDNPRGAIPLLTTASMMKVPADGMPETAPYSYAPWEALAHVYFRLEEYDKAKEMAAKALELNLPSPEWLRKLIEYDTKNCPTEPVTEEWHTWTQDNLRIPVPRHTVIRTLQESSFTPGQVITVLKVSDAKK
jgi:glycosyltransferase involved in cell wall biosynthesis